jgi:Family of unknown function (DUF5906)
MAKTLTEYQNELKDTELNLTAWRVAEEQSQNEEEKFKLRDKINEAEGLITEVKKHIAQLEDKEQKLQKKNNWKKEKTQVKQAIDENYVGYLIPENKFIYCRDYGVKQSNVQFKMMPATAIVRALGKMAGITITGVDHNEMIDYFNDIGRTYFDVTSSFNTGKWNEQEIYNKMSVIREHWIKPDYDSEEYDPMLDFLILTVAGGKQENVEHLEKWVAFKYLFPNKNANIPNLDIGGLPGGNGKGRFVELLKTIFTNACVIQAHREELEKFNSNWEMAVVLYYDEPEEKELAAGKLKQATGSEDMRIEKKGIDATMADRNYNFIFLSNNEKGVVKLSGGSDGGEDRRYSVITTDIVQYDMLLENGFTVEEAQAELDRIAQVLIKDRKQVSRWLGKIIKKYDVENLKNLKPLHGRDYQARFEEQKESIIEAFDKILPVVESQCFIPLNILSDLTRVLTENTQHKDKNVGEKFELYLKRNQINYTVQDRKQWHMLWNGAEVKKAQNKCYILNTGNPNCEFEMNTVRSDSPKKSELTKDNCELA